MKSTISFKILTLAAIVSFFVTCKKKADEKAKFELTQLGANNFKPSTWGIRGFNHNGSPIIHHELNYLYELDEANNTFNKIGSIIPNPASVATGKIVQDGLGNYFYHSGTQGEIYILNKTTNKWDTAVIAPGYKNQMIANANGDILIYINNTTFGGIESFYKKAANATNWVKVIDMPINNPNQFAPQFLSNNGRAFFTASFAPSNQIDGSGGYNETVLNINTGKFELFYDKSDPDNFPAIEANNYGGFNSFYTSPNGNFYILVPAPAGPITYLYKISSETLPAKFVKVNEFNHPPLESGSYITMRGCIVNESTGVVKFRSSCQFGQYSHKNLGIAKTNAPELEVLQHDGAQNVLIASPNGNVYVHNWEGFLYKWK